MANGFTYEGSTFLSHPLFVETILPFLLVFTIVFAVLQKSKIFGDGKRQVDAIVALVVGLLVISFGQATGFIVQLIPFLAVALVVILVFMILIGSFGKSGEEMLPKGLKTFLMIVAGIAVVIAVLYITNLWSLLYDWIIIGTDTGIATNAFFVIIIIAAIAFVWYGSKPSGSGTGKKGE